MQANETVAAVDYDQLLDVMFFARMLRDYQVVRQGIVKSAGLDGTLMVAIRGAFKAWGRPVPRRALRLGHVADNRLLALMPAGTQKGELLRFIRTKLAVPDMGTPPGWGRDDDLIWATVLDDPLLDELCAAYNRACPALPITTAIGPELRTHLAMMFEVVPTWQTCDERVLGRLKRHGWPQGQIIYLATLHEAVLYRRGGERLERFRRFVLAHYEVARRELPATYRAPHLGPDEPD